MFPLFAPLLALAQPAPPPLPVLPPPGSPPINLSHPAPPVLPPVVTPAVPVPWPPAGWAAAQMPCPGPAAHPFQRLPRICSVLPCPCEDSGGHGHGAFALPYWTKEFHEAAHVPVPRFTADGLPACLDGLLIYEGMCVTVYANGVYDVSFTAEVPDMPATVRLQLVLQNPADRTRGEYRITLPPFRLEPRAEVRPGDPTANTFHVAHRGYSSLLVFVAPPGGIALNGRVTGEVGPRWVVTRVGTARFGTPLAVTDPSR